MGNTLTEDSMGEEDAIEKYEWEKAAKSAEKAFQLPGNSNSVAKDREKLGLYYALAARQSENARKFQKFSQKAVEAFETAAELYSKENAESNLGKSNFCIAKAKYAKTWNEPSVTHKREMLEKCINLLKNSKEAFQRNKDQTNYGKACNLSLLSLLDLGHVLPSSEERDKVLQEGIYNATQAISIFSKNKQKDCLIFALSYASILTDFFLDSTALYTERKELSKQILTYSKKAVQLSKQVNNPYSKALAYNAMATASSFFVEKAGNTIGKENSRHMLEQALIIRDKVLIGKAYNSLANFSYSGVQEETDLKNRKNRLQRAIHYSQKAIKPLKITNQYYEMALAHYFSAESYQSIARDFQINSQDKVAILRNSIRNGEKSQEYAVLSGSPEMAFTTSHALSKALYESSTLEKTNETKVKLLQRALSYRKKANSAIEMAFANNIWVEGMGFIYQAQIEAGLANLETIKDTKLEFLKTAIVHYETGIALCKKWCEVRSESFYTAWTATYEQWLANSLEEQYSLTEDKDILFKANEIYRDIAENFTKADLPSRVAETYWKTASNLDALGEYWKSSESFQEAKKQFETAAKAIPEFRNFYLNFETYMNAWEETETAKQEHENGNYAGSAEHYKKASNLLQKTRSHKYLSVNSCAWANLELSEHQSAQEQNEKAIKSLKETIKLFEKTKRTAEIEYENTEKIEEKQMAAKIVKVSDLRKQFCMGRILIEEAKLLDKKGGHLSSSEKYGYAAVIFHSILKEQQSRQTKTEIDFIIVLAKAWQKMTKAEHESQPAFFREASELFEVARALTSSERTKMLILGHSHFCRALEASCQFFDTLENPPYETALKELLTASNYYAKAGSEISTQHAKATELFLNAFLNINIAKKEIDINKKEKHYMVAEKLLQTAAGFFSKAGYPEKRTQVQRILKEATEEKKLCISLGETLNSSQITARTTPFNIQNTGYEKTLGLAEFEDAHIQSRLTGPREVELGEAFEIRMDFINVAKNSAMLVRIDELLPPKIKLITTSPQFSRNNDTLDIEGLRLEPLKVESIKLKLEATDVGNFCFHPQTVYVNEKGKFRTHFPEMVPLFVTHRLKFEFRNQNAQKIFDFLLRSFVEDYMRKRLPLEWSGWRSLMEVVKNVKISRRSVYGDGNYRGLSISELEYRGLVESRVFPEERGRGGKVRRVRVFYDREIVRQQIDRKIMETGKNKAAVSQA
jgi:hypothetical protein